VLHRETSEAIDFAIPKWGRFRRTGPPRAERGAGSSSQERKIFLLDKKQFLEEFAEMLGMRAVELTSEISLWKPMAG
jgi:hypothetical protein